MLSDAVKCEFSLLLPKSLLCALASSRLAFGAKAAFLSLLCLVLVVLLLLMWQRLEMSAMSNEIAPMPIYTS